MNKFKGSKRLVTWRLQNIIRGNKANGETLHVHGLENSKLLKCQFFLNWSTD